VHEQWDLACKLGNVVRLQAKEELRLLGMKQYLRNCTRYIIGAHA